MQPSINADMEHAKCPIESHNSELLDTIGTLDQTLAKLAAKSQDRRRTMAPQPQIALAQQGAVV